MAIGKNQAEERYKVPLVKRYCTMNRILLWMSLALILACLPAGVAADTTDPTVTIKSYQVSPSIILPGDQGTITITMANTAGQASQTESTVQTLTGASTTTTTTNTTPPQPASPAPPPPGAKPMILNST